jgi:enoyl-CoA hydratase/carnithine racemase
VAEGLQKAVTLAEQQFKALVIWSGDEPFSAGADLESMLPAFMAVGVAAIEDAEGFLQQTMLRIRYAGVPVVSAIRGLALGGGCELAIHSARRVAAMESYIGLVEVGVGLVPGAGGLAYIARRAAENMALLRLPDKRPDYRLDRAHGEFLTQLGAHAAPHARAPGALHDAVLARLQLAFDVREADPEEAWDVARRCGERKSNAYVEY